MPTAWMPLWLYALRMGASVFRLKRERLHRAFDGQQLHPHKKHTPTPTTPQTLVPNKNGCGRSLLPSVGEGYPRSEMSPRARATGNANSCSCLRVCIYLSSHELCPYERHVCRTKSSSAAFGPHNASSTTLCIALHCTLAHTGRAIINSRL